MKDLLVCVLIAFLAAFGFGCENKPCGEWFMKGDMAQMNADLQIDQFVDFRTVTGFGPTDLCAEARAEIARDHCGSRVRLRWYYDGGAQNKLCNFKVYVGTSVTAYAYPTTKAF
jgi:hypothetical protein